MTSVKDIPPVDLDYIRIRCRECEGGCWEWTGYVRRGDSPTVSFRRPDESGIVKALGWPVRQIVYMLARKAKRPNGLKFAIRPSCDNPLCVAPLHLKVVRRGTWGKGKKKPLMQGVRISRAKAAKSKVPDSALPQFREDGADLKALAQQHGITLAYAYMLRDGRYRASATSPFAGLGART